MTLVEGSFQVVNPDTSATGELSWYVLICEPQRDHTAARRLGEMGVEVYFPMLTKNITQSVRTYFGMHRRKKSVQYPIFPGYLFARLNLPWQFGFEEVAGLRHDPFLRLGQDPAILTDKEISRIREIEAALMLSPLPYKVGDRVRLNDSAFGEMDVTVARMDDHQRIELLMDMLGQKVRIVASSDRITKP